jgi:hypothetical protein
MKRILLLILCAVTFPVLALSEPSAPSINDANASIVIEADFATMIQVTGVSDITIDDWQGDAINPGNNPNMVEHLCVFSNFAEPNFAHSRNYNIQILSDSGSGFKLHGVNGQNNANFTIPYHLVYVDSAGTSHPVTPGESLSGLTGSNALGCRYNPNQSNTSLQLSIDAVPRENLIAGSYTDTISVVVTPMF